MIKAQKELISNAPYQFRKGGFLMKKTTLSAFTTKNATLTEVFLFIYVSFLYLGFGANGEYTPSHAGMTAIILSAIVVISLGTKVMDESEEKR